MAKFKFGDKVRFWNEGEWINGIYIGSDRSVEGKYSRDSCIVAEFCKELWAHQCIDFWYPNPKDLKRGWKK